MVEGLHSVTLVVASMKVMEKMCKRLGEGRLEEKTVLLLSLSSRRNGQSTGGQTDADTTQSQNTDGSGQ